jgi:uncharacterized cupredoxin-like copper-binding protein
MNNNSVFHPFVALVFALSVSISATPALADSKKHGQGGGHGMHNEPNSKLLEPGRSGEIIWTFPKLADLEFACNIPGHYDSGMVGKIKLMH